MNTAIIVAAGSGQRFDPTTPKQFVLLAGKPVLIHSLKAFEAANTIDEIIVVVRNEQIEQVQKVVIDHRISKLSTIVAGGATRAESVRNGLDAVDTSTNIVAVHDGARPLVTAHEIDACVYRAEETGAACVVAAVTDTIKSIRADEIVATLDRDKLRRALTPQAFKYDVLKRAFDSFDLDAAVTDECYLVEKLGHPITFVEGNSRNIKITSPEDLVFAELLLTKNCKKEAN